MKKIDLKKELKANKTLLLIMQGVEYNDLIVNTAKQLSGKSICYVTLNKTSESLNELFKKHKVDTTNIVYIDAISKTIKKTPDQAKNVYFISSPGALTELSLVITKFLRHEFEYLIFDSITNLQIYQEKAPIAKFITSLVNNIKTSNTRAVFYALNIKEQQELLNESSMCMDKTINITTKR